MTGPNVPDPASNRSLAGGTPRWDVTVRLRARTPEAARERLDRWVLDLEGFASVESVEVDEVEPTVLEAAIGRAMPTEGST